MPHFTLLIFSPRLRSALAFSALLSVVTVPVAHAQQPATPPAAPATPIAPAPVVTAPPITLGPPTPTSNFGLPQPTPGVKPTMPPSTASRRPDLFAPIPYYEKRDNFFFAGAADVRYRNRTISQQNETIGSYIAATRFTADYIRGNPFTGDERGGARVQFVLEDDSRGTSLNRLRASELYVFYRFLFPGVSANVRVGQFVLPFGLLAVYDTPLQPIQPLYEKSLGLRVDTGVMLEGDYGLYHYATALTTGAGPNRRDRDNNLVITFRLDRSFTTRFGKVQIGGSLLTGNGPMTNFDTELSPSGFASASATVKKTRFAADGQYFFRGITARGEVVFGADDQQSVWGYFVEGDVPIRGRLSAVAFSRLWTFPTKPEKTNTLGAGFNFAIANGIVLRSLFEYERNVPDNAGTSPVVIRRLTLQTRLNF